MFSNENFHEFVVSRLNDEISKNRFIFRHSHYKESSRYFRFCQYNIGFINLLGLTYAFVFIDHFWKP